MITKQANELRAFSCQTTKSQLSHSGRGELNSSATDLSKFLKYQMKIANDAMNDHECSEED